MRDPKFPLTIPQVNINGTSCEELVDQKLTARTAVAKAVERLRAATPHARDYQGLQGLIHYSEASVLHRERMTFLNDLWAELECEAYAIQEQGK